MLNTFKTVADYLKASLDRYTFLSLEGNSLDKVANYRWISDELATSGQPTEKQFSLIKQAGYETVINLAPKSIIENSLVDERQLLADLGLNYVHIPVNFTNPTESDFDQFVDSMQAARGKQVWVHCAANCRVSAFIYRYRRSVLGISETLARADLEAVWRPFGPWKKFVSRV